MINSNPNETESTPNDRLEAALAYAAAGFPVFPIWGATDRRCNCGNADCENIGKHPHRLAPRGHHSASTDPEWITNVWTTDPSANIGIDLESAGLLVIGPDSPAWLAHFKARGLPETLITESGGGEGHLHYWYRRPEGCPITRLCKSGEYDIISDGYAVAAPGTHKLGLRRLLTPLETPILEAPDWSVQMLEDKEAARTDFVPLDPDEPPVPLRGAALQRWTGETVEYTPDGSVNRSKTLIKIAEALIHAGLTRRWIVEALENRDVRLFERPKYAGRPEAEKRYAEVFGFALLLTEPQGSTDAPLFHSLWDTVDEPPPAYVVDGILAEQTVAFLFGKSGTFKTFTALSLSIHVAAGADWMGRKTKKGRVLYIIGEGRRAIGKRVRAFKQAFPDFDTTDCHIDITDNPISLYDPASVASLRAHATEPYSLIIVDTLSRNSMGGDESSNSDMRQVLVHAQSIAAQTGACVLIIHHTTKASNGNEPRGASSLINNADTSIKAIDGSDMTVCLTFDKQRDDSKDEEINLKAEVVWFEDGTSSLVMHPHDGAFIPRDANVKKPGTKETAADKRTQMTLAMLVGLTDPKTGEYPEGVTFSTWLDRLLDQGIDTNKSSFTRDSKKLVDEGYAQKDGKLYKWTKPDTGSEA